MVTVLAFLVALALLIAVHEYGHYRMAVACGVKVLRFSVGFGMIIWRWQPKNSPTEFVIGMVPLGGYVRMLDEREGPVAPEERHLAFNRRPLWHRTAIVAAGPLANLLLAVALYAATGWIGAREAAPVLASPLPHSLAGFSSQVFRCRSTSLRQGSTALRRKARRVWRLDSRTLARAGFG